MIMAAIRLVAREGLTKLTNRSLALEAGVTPGVLQHHFGSTDRVLEAAISHCVEIAQSAVIEIDNVSGYFASLKQFILEQPEISAFTVEVFSGGRLNAWLYPVLAAQQESYRQVTRKVLRASKLPIDPGLIEIITAALDGIVFQKVALGDTDHQAERLTLQFETLERMVYGYPEIARAVRRSP